MRVAIAVAVAAVAGAGHGTYQEGWGPPVGAALPILAAEDQRGVKHQLASLAGERGLLLFFVRSADW